MDSGDVLMVKVIEFVLHCSSGGNTADCKNMHDGNVCHCK